MAKDQSCNVTGIERVSPVRSMTKIKSNDRSIKAAVVQRPIAVALDASNWHAYQGGILSVCGYDLNHSVTLIGFKENQYWIVRNSWGTRWGENGYIKLAMGANTCNIRSVPFTLNLK